MNLTRTLPGVLLGSGLLILILVTLCQQPAARALDEPAAQAVDPGRADLLRRMKLVMGDMPDRAKLPPLDVKVVDEKKTDGYTQQTITFATEGDERITADLYLPAAAPAGGKSPAIVALHQTSVNGRRDLAGGAKNPNNSYAPELARRGYVVICPDYPSFGDLKDYDFAKDKYDSGTMKGIFNHMRAVDVLVARNDVDPKRIGATGHSLGGHNAIFLGVFDERIQVVVSSCGWTPFHDYYGGNLKGWTQDRYMPRIRDMYGSDPDKMPFDFPELIAAIAPRAFFSVSPTKDANFSVEGVKKAIAIATPAFEKLGAKDKLQVRYPDDEHNFSPAMREEAFAFVDRVLGNIRVAGVSPAIPAKQPASETPAAQEDFAAELPRIPGTDPGVAIKKFQTLPGFHVELVASEPNVASPVAIDFDERGRMFVCEMRDYSEQDKERLGTIRMLEDVDGDGTYEKSTIYADDLSWPTALICYGGGIFVGAAPDIYWLKDTNGDGKVDERKTVFTGFNRSNVQGLINCFRWGIDNRIHGATSTSGGKVRKPEQPESAAIDLSGRDFSFDPRTMELRPESGGAQHGMSFDDWGRKFVSSNSDHIQMVMIDDRYIAGPSHVSIASARESIAADGPQATVFRISQIEPWRIVRTRLRVSGAVKGMIEGGGRPAGYFTGATGVTIYRGDAFPHEYIGQAFIGDVGSNIVHRKVLEPNGVGFIAKRVDDGKEFLASTDVWFRPSQFANTPDGTLYVIDTCRETIEHPASLPPMIKKHLDLTSGRDRGRIWRVVPDGHKLRTRVDFTNVSTLDLVALLEHRNGWHRDTAARLLYERQDISVVAPLQKLVTTSEVPEARVHAMYALASLGKLTADVATSMLSGDDAHVREHGVIASERLLANEPGLFSLLMEKLKDPDARVRYRAALALGTVRPANPDRGVELSDALAELLRTGGKDPWMRLAALVSSRGVSYGVLFDLMRDEAFVTSESGPAILTQLARMEAASNENAAGLFLSEMELMAKPQAVAPIMQGLAEGVALSNRSLFDSAKATPRGVEVMTKLLDDALRTAGDENAPIPQRLGAIRMLSYGPFESGESLLQRMIGGASQPQAIQLAALTALDRSANPKVAAILIKVWRDMSPAVRAAAANAIFARPERAAAFLDAVDAGTIKATDVDHARLKTLSGSDDAKLRDRAKKLLAAAPSEGRQQVFETYRPALSLAGDAARGKAVFEKSCASCHRLNDIGNEIGPNLAAMQSRGAEAILLNVIDPNREVNPQFVDYIVQTKAGRTSSGLLASETAGGITLKRAGGETETIARSEIKRMRSTGLSIMPEGLEVGVDVQTMADLIAYVLSAK